MYKRSGLCDTSGVLFLGILLEAGGGVAFEFFFEFFFFFVGVFGRWVVRLGVCLVSASPFWKTEEKKGLGSKGPG